MVVIHRMLGSTDGTYFLALNPRDKAGIALPLTQYLGILEHAIVEIMVGPDSAVHRKIPAARTLVDGLRLMFSEGATLVNQHIIEHYAIADGPTNQTRLATRLPSRTQDHRAVSDGCVHSRSPASWVGASRPI